MLRSLLNRSFAEAPVRPASFQLISLRPYLSFNELGIPYTDFKKPFVYHSRIERVEDVPSVDVAVYAKDSYTCADDICYVALKVGRNMEARAHGINNAIQSAVMEASRKVEAEYCRYIRIEDPQHKRNRAGAAAVVLENATAAGFESKDVLVISLA